MEEKGDVVIVCCSRKRRQDINLRNRSSDPDADDAQSSDSNIDPKSQYQLHLYPLRSPQSRCPPYNYPYPLSSRCCKHVYDSVTRSVTIIMVSSRIVSHLIPLSRIHCASVLRPPSRLAYGKRLLVTVSGVPYCQKRFYPSSFRIALSQTLHSLSDHFERSH